MPLINTETKKIHQGDARKRKGNCNASADQSTIVKISGPKATKMVKDKKDRASFCGKCYPNGR